jgi:hypothetical protein
MAVRKDGHFLNAMLLLNKEDKEQFKKDYENYPDNQLCIMYACGPALIVETAKQLGVYTKNKRATSLVLKSRENRF